MIKQITRYLAIFTACTSAFALNPSGPVFNFLPITQTKTIQATALTEIKQKENQTIQLIKKTLHITPTSPYQSVRTRFILNEHNKPDALLVYLLSSQYKSIEIVRINLTKDFKVSSIQRDYALTTNDYAQMPGYAIKTKATCPDTSVQFVIGNNFNGDQSVEKEVRYVYELAKSKGYQPFLMDINDSDTQPPTVKAYEDWLSCPNVKGFYNESHGSPFLIMLSDGEFTADLIKKDLKSKLSKDVVLFDSCKVFNNPMLGVITNRSNGNAQQYMGGIISLPFGASEKTASCFWNDALKGTILDDKLVVHCAVQSGLEPFAFRITNKKQKKLRPAT